MFIKYIEERSINTKGIHNTVKRSGCENMFSTCVYVFTYVSVNVRSVYTFVR